jgi:hypothetical protein
MATRPIFRHSAFRSRPKRPRGVKGGGTDGNTTVTAAPWSTRDAEPPISLPGRAGSALTRSSKLIAALGGAVGLISSLIRPRSATSAWDCTAFHQARPDITGHARSVARRTRKRVRGNPPRVQIPPPPPTDKAKRWPRPRGGRRLSSFGLTWLHFDRSLRCLGSTRAARRADSPRRGESELRRVRSG